MTATFILLAVIGAIVWGAYDASPAAERRRDKAEAEALERLRERMRDYDRGIDRGFWH